MDPRLFYYSLVVELQEIQGDASSQEEKGNGKGCRRGSNYHPTGRFPSVTIAFSQAKNGEWLEKEKLRQLEEEKKRVEEEKKKKEAEERKRKEESRARLKAKASLWQ